jgi:hypothetical protein
MFYDIDTVRYVFEHYTTLSHGKWPDPKNNDDAGIRQKGGTFHAPYEDPCLFCGEIGRRVKQCGSDGLTVEIIYGMLLGVAWGVDLYCDMYHHNRDDVYRRINRVAWYCTDGEWSKRLPYDEWKSNTRNKRFRRG